MTRFDINLKIKLSKFYKNKNVLITGGTGLIGRQLTSILQSFNAQITLVSLDSPYKIDKKVTYAVLIIA